MKENWVELEEFPEYAISNHAYVLNLRTGVERRMSANQQGLIKVTLMDANGNPLTRSLAVLVASAFVEPEEEHFDTVIHLDGDRSNCVASNLMWRPRWFAIKYHKQFQFETFHHEGNVRIVDVKTGEEYRSVKEVCQTNGLYYYDVIKSYIEHTFVPITYQEFDLVD